MTPKWASEWTQIIGWPGLSAVLTEPEQLLSAFFASSNVGLAIIDTQLDYLAINKALAEMNGVPVNAHWGKSLREILGDPAADSIEPILHRVVLTGKPVMNVAITLQLPTRTEVGHWVNHYFPINDALGKVARIGVVVTEVTEQKKLEEKLAGLATEVREKNERLRLLLELTSALNSDSDLRHVFPSLAESIRRVLPLHWVDLSILDESSKSIRLYAMDSLLEMTPLHSDLSIPLSGAICGEAVVARRPKVCSRSELERMPALFVKPFLEAGVQAFCCIPVVTPKGVIGCFNVASTNDRGFQSEELDLLRQIGLQLANALDITTACTEGDRKSGVAPDGESVRVETRTHSERNFDEMVGSCPALRRVLKQAQTVAPSEATVLIMGETGTGKELIARAIHHMSSRRGGPFIKLNCAAIPGGLLESELFGHEKGAFTGAVARKIGRLEVANHGTLFLDEVGEIPPELQPKLLRFLQEPEFERLGSNRTIRVNVRLLAATNRDLAQSVGEGRFRSDLYYRLNVFPIRMPALSERATDIPFLVHHFVQKHARRMNKNIETIPAEAMDALTKWEWPGNIRELENFIERSVILSEGSVLNVPVADLQRSSPQPSVTLEGLGRDYILRALRETKGLVDGPRGAAARLSMKPLTLRSIMRRMNILPKNYNN